MFAQSPQFVHPLLIHFLTAPHGRNAIINVTVAQRCYSYGVQHLNLRGI